MSDNLAGGLTVILMNIIDGKELHDQALMNSAIDALGVDIPEKRHQVAAYIDMFIVEYRGITLGDMARPGGPEIVNALASIAKAARQIDDALAVLQVARQTSVPGGGQAEDLRYALFPLAVESVRHAMGLPAYEWRGGFEDPLAGAFGRVARDLEDLSARFTKSDVRAPTRGQHPAFVRLIVNLAKLYEGWHGKAASAPYSGDNGPNYVGPFVRFVHAVAPLAAIEPLPSARVIDRALRTATDYLRN